uniref:Uncharacterized protein n=1 Tax=Nelumbo nucifera TaxID=4432 RepID=A0A822Y094_NELNU|nr:TPA_asm: hypothetical protein HUJ06_025939 [Nelumbo nucifera]
MEKMDRQGFMSKKIKKIVLLIAHGKLITHGQDSGKSLLGNLQRLAKRT